MIKLASETDCTSCGACAFVCPKHCIEMKIKHNRGDNSS